MFKISILTIGDEICIGQIVNSNAAWLAAQCTALGANVITHSSVTDDKEIIKSETARLLAMSDVVILTGGLGPTHDDMTKPALCEFFDDKLVLHEPTLQNIEERFKKRGFAMSERNRAQAEIPSKCIPLRNDAGTAPGMLFEYDSFLGKKYLISLPGVPREMMSIMETGGLPFIARQISESNSEITLYKTLLTAGIPESHLADLIGEPDTFLNGGTLAFLPSYTGVKLRIGVTGKNDESAKIEIIRIEKHIRSRAERFIIGEGNESLASIVGAKLKEANKTVSVAESCTGGMLGAALTDISGSSRFFIGGAIVYSNEAKIRILNVNKETIEKFGAVSEQTAIELAANVRKKFNTNFGIAITGIAGPTGGTEEKPVGTVFIGLSDENGTIARRFSFSDNRAINRERSVGTALALLMEKLFSY